jgi:guanylate kinase
MKRMMNTDNINENRGRLIIISGPAGCGKSTVLKELLNFAEYKFSVSATARKPRNGETDGIDYYFISKEEFEQKISNGEMLEYVEYAGNYYGTLKDPVEKMLNENYNVILEIEVDGAINVKKLYPEAIMIFLTPPSYSELERRLKNRGTESEEVQNRRLEISKKEIARIDKYDYFVINEIDMQKKAAFDINCIVETAKNKMNPKKAEKFLINYFKQ